MMLTTRTTTNSIAGPRAPATASAFARSRARRKPVEELIRFVVGPDGDVVPDVKRKLPGRGIWITATRAARRRGGQAQRVSRAASSATCACAADLAAQTERLLERAALDALAIAGKAGQVVAGFAKVEAALERGRGVGAAARRRRRRRRQAQARRCSAPATDE